jgi:hypothetical protein
MIDCTGCNSVIWKEVHANILKEPLLCTETNEISEENSDTQLFEAGKYKGMALLGGHRPLTIEKGFFAHYLGLILH